MPDPSPDTPNVAERTHPVLDGRPVMIGDVLIAPHPDDTDPEGNTLEVEFHVGSMFWDGGHDVDYSTGKPVWPSRPRGWTVAPIDEEADCDLPYEWPLSECRRPDTPSVCPTCGSNDRNRFPIGAGCLSDLGHHPWHDGPATPAAAGSSSPDVAALAKQMGLADDPFFAREYQTNIYVHALMHLAEAQAARITELEAAIRVHRDRFLDGPYFQPDDGALWAVLAESPDG